MLEYSLVYLFLNHPSIGICWPKRSKTRSKTQVKSGFCVEETDTELGVCSAILINQQIKAQENNYLYFECSKCSLIALYSSIL